MSPNLRWACPLIMLMALTAPLSAREPAAGSKPQSKPAWEKPTPTSVEDLRAIERGLGEALGAVRPATVHVQVGYANGSGVVISKEGHVLTAAHVSGTPGQGVLITFPDGREVRGTTLGRYPKADAGLIKITDEGDWPIVPLSRSADVSPGDWCFALGYPGGFDLDRGPVLRIGRVIRPGPKTLWTDCALLGGDSGGPLFDMEGRIIGIHSRIARPTEANFHAAADAFHESWETLAAGREWVPMVTALGVETKNAPRGALVERVRPDTPAEKAGIQVNDVIVRLDEHPITGPESLQGVIRGRKPDEKVKLHVLRATEEVEIEATLGQLPEP